MQGAKPIEDEVVQEAETTWANLKYFIDAVVPVAEASNVRMALHPNDPPVPVSAGSPQIMSTLAGWKRMADIRKSPANCIIFDCGVTRELGENPVEVARYFGQRDQIGHVHYRNVRLRKPYIDYTEVYPDNGDNNMLAVMKALVAVKYKYMIFPEHAPGLDVDSEFKTNNAAAWAYHVAYARAMLQVALAQR
jgi:mannonate dehydratase